MSSVTLCLQSDGVSWRFQDAAGRSLGKERFNYVIKELRLS